MGKKITVSDEAYWKLMEVKVKLRCETWDILAEKIYEMVFKDEKSE